MQDPGWVYSLENAGFCCCRGVTRQAPPRGGEGQARLGVQCTSGAQQVRFCYKPRGKCRCLRRHSWKQCEVAPVSGLQDLAQAGTLTISRGPAPL